MKRIRLLALLLFALSTVALPVYADRNSGSGSITANAQAVTMSCDSVSTVTLIVGGTFSATLQVNTLAADGTTWSAATTIYNYPTDTPTPVTSITSTGSWELNVAGKLAVRVICTAYTSGTATVAMNGSPGVGILKVNVVESATGGGLPTGAATSANQTNGTQQTQGNVASGATDSGNPVKVGGVYSASPPSLTTGQRGDLQMDASANLKDTLATLLWSEDATNATGKSTNKVVIASTYTPSLDTSFKTAVTHNSKATAAVLYGVDVTNENAAVRYFQIFNSTGGTGTVLMSFEIPAGSATAPARLQLGPAQWGPNGVYLSTGLTWGISSTDATYTGATNTDHNVNLLYYRNAAVSFDATFTGNIKRSSMRFNARRAMAEDW